MSYIGNSGFTILDNENLIINKTNKQLSELYRPDEIVWKVIVTNMKMYTSQGLIPNNQIYTTKVEEINELKRVAGYIYRDDNMGQGSYDCHFEVAYKTDAGFLIFKTKVIEQNPSNQIGLYPFTAFPNGPIEEVYNYTSMPFFYYVFGNDGGFDAVEIISPFPIFLTKEQCDVYIETGLGYEKALNYKDPDAEKKELEKYIKIQKVFFPINSQNEINWDELYFHYIRNFFGNQITNRTPYFEKMYIDNIEQTTYNYKNYAFYFNKTDENDYELKSTDKATYSFNKEEYAIDWDFNVSNYSGGRDEYIDMYCNTIFYNLTKEETVYLDTNIPVFFTLKEAKDYLETGEGLNKALNYAGTEPWLTDKFEISESVLSHLANTTRYTFGDWKESGLSLQEIKEYIQNADLSEKVTIFDFFKNVKVLKNEICTSDDPKDYYCNITYYIVGPNKDTAALLQLKLEEMIIDNEEDNYLKSIKIYPRLYYTHTHIVYEPIIDYNWVGSRGYWKWTMIENGKEKTDDHKGCIYPLIEYASDKFRQKFITSSIENIKISNKYSYIIIDTNIPIQNLHDDWIKNPNPEIFSNYTFWNQLILNKPDYTIDRDTVEDLIEITQNKFVQKDESSCPDIYANLNNIMDIPFFLDAYYISKN